jgi:hypothetical protein
MNYDARQVYEGVETAQYANLSSLFQLPVNDAVSVTGSKTIGDSTQKAAVKIENKSSKLLAFFIRLEITNGRDGEEVVPVTYSDNYTSLLPGESKTIIAEYDLSDMDNQTAYAKIKGVNVSENVVPLTDVGVVKTDVLPMGEMMLRNTAASRRFYVYVKGTYEFKIRDCRGRTMFERKAAGPDNFIIPKAGISSGTYVVNIKTGDVDVRRKVVIAE